MKGLDNFFKRMFAKNICTEDNAAIIRRLDLDCDSKLCREEFMKGISAQEPYSKMMIRAKLKREEEFGPKGDKHECSRMPTIEHKQSDQLKLMRKHATAQGNMTNKARRLDREYENASGVSPIRARN